MYLMAGAIVIGSIFMKTDRQLSANMFRSTTTIVDGIPFERYCGYVMKVGHGSIMFEDGHSIAIVYLLFRDQEGKPSITKVLYGDTQRLDTIEKDRYYDIGARRYDEGFSFPRRLDVVDSCK
jgi:hypothetical protein